MTDRIDDGIGTYDVVLLVEHELSRSDAAQVHSLHEDIADQVVYHVILPVDDAAAQIGSSMGTLGSGEVPSAPLALSDQALEAVYSESMEQANQELASTIIHLQATGAGAKGILTGESPVGALATTVDEVDAREAIVLTSPHVVAEFFHVDWSSQARRKLGVPVLHLLEHETFDEQAGGGEGVTGL